MGQYLFVIGKYLKKSTHISYIKFKGTHTVYFSSSLYITNQKAIMHRTDFYCITHGLHALLGKIRPCICLFCGFDLLARWRYYPI